MSFAGASLLVQSAPVAGDLPVVPQVHTLAEQLLCPISFWCFPSSHSLQTAVGSDTWFWYLATGHAEHATVLLSNFRPTGQNEHCAEATSFSA